MGWHKREMPVTCKDCVAPESPHAVPPTLSHKDIRAMERTRGRGSTGNHLRASGS